ncbi:MAG: acyltransferase family protein [Pseudomonas sp.]|nr:acyltransferase family protein [Pseudomonas sp.]
MSVAHSKGMRNDITGLRALAVIPVLLFHAKVPFIPGGFLGVDLFFFISGFLITGDILRKVKSEKFSFLSFYDRRARRILPALLFVMLIVALLSPIFMVPYDIKNLGQSIVASTFAANNILLYITSGYWSLASEFKPLYHTWSLGVEEQYYFIVPIVFIAFYKLIKGTKPLYLFITLFIIASFLYSFFVDSKEYNFLILFTRVWELMCGGLLAAYLNKNTLKSNNYLSALGVFCIVVSFLFPYVFSSNQAIVNALPIFGAFLIVGFSSSTATYAGRLLSSKPFVFIGLISYSVYLWHQPLIAFFRLSSEYEPNPYVLAAVSFVAIPLAYLTWRLIENPARDFNFAPAKLFYPVLALCASGIVTTGLVMHKTYGFQSYFSEYSYDGDPQQYVDLPRKYSQIPTQNAERRTQNAEKERLVVLGNSFARDFINMLLEHNLDRKFDIVYDDLGCNVTEQRLAQMLHGSQYVVLANAWALGVDASDAYEELAVCVDDLNSRIQGRKLFVLGAKNFGWNNNFVKMLPSNSFVMAKTKPLDNIDNFNRMAVLGIDGYIDMLGLLKNSSGEVNIFTDEGKFITYDTNHLTKNGAKYLAAIVFEKTELAVLNK